MNKNTLRIKNVFQMFKDVIGEKAKDWKINYNTVTKRYSIEDKTFSPFGWNTYTADELVTHLQFAMRAIALMENKNTGSYWPTRNYTDMELPK